MSLMSSMTKVYLEYYPKLIKVLPMNNDLFIQQLCANHFLPGDAKECIMAKATLAEKAAFFLDNYISIGFDNGSNPLFLDLLKLMEGSENWELRSVAKEINSKIIGTVLLVIIMFVDMMCILHIIHTSCACRAWNKLDSFACTYIHTYIRIDGGSQVLT